MHLVQEFIIRIYTTKSHPTTPKCQRCISLLYLLPFFCFSWSSSFGSSMIVEVFLFSYYHGKSNLANDYLPFKEGNWNGMDTSLEWMVVIGQRRFTSGHHTVGGEEEDHNNHGRTKAWTSLAFGSGWTALGCIDPNNNNNNNNNIFKVMLESNVFNFV